MKSGRRVGIVLSLVLAILTCYVSNNLNARFQHRSETIEQQLSIFAGRSYLLDGKDSYQPEFQNRVLFPAILNIAGAVPIGTTGQWYLLLRLATAFLAFLVFHWVLARQAAAHLKIIAVGMGLLSHELILTFNHGWEHPSDFPDVIFISLFIWAALERRRWTLLALALAASTNRESSVYAGVLWFFVHAARKTDRSRGMEALFAGFLSLASYGLVLALRYGLGRERAMVRAQSVTGWSNLSSNVLDFFRHPTPSSWPVLFLAMMTPVVLWLWSNREVLAEPQRRLLIASAFIGLTSLMFGVVNELRIFIPATVIMTFVATSAEIQAKVHDVE
jgi:hypothetical protein